MTSKEIKEALSRDPSTSYWLEEAIRRADNNMDLSVFAQDIDILMRYVDALISEAWWAK